jgi:hypothetical protein
VILLALVVSHPFRKKKRKGWGTEHFSRQHSPSGPVPLNAWITAGTNGSDISRDDGRTWQPLDNGNWNALSLPFVVGPNGRIGRLNPAALPKP